MLWIYDDALEVVRMTNGVVGRSIATIPTWRGC